MTIPDRRALKIPLHTDRISSGRVAVREWFPSVPA